MFQYLGVDLGYRQVITGVATQGRRGSREFVYEYYLWFSSDNNTWTVYTNEYGTPLVSPALSVVVGHHRRVSSIIQVEKHNYDSRCAEIRQRKLISYM